MIPLEVLKCQSLFSLLYKIDKDLAEQSRSLGCPGVGDHCIMPITGVSLEGVLLNCKRLLKTVSVCAADVMAVANVFYRNLSDFGIARCIGHLSYFWLQPFVRKIVRRPPWKSSRGFATSGGPPLTGGGTIFLKYFLTANAVAAFWGMS